jgi:nucleoside-diphosphate-sugar epimerase
MALPPQTKLALLGATGHIAKGLMFAWQGRPELEVDAFARSVERVENFLRPLRPLARVHPRPLSDFGDAEYAAVINCVGIGDPQVLADRPEVIFAVTETYDDLVLDHLSSHPGTLYVNFSSGAVYGTEFPAPAGDATVTSLPVNRLSPAHYYGLAKLNAEAKHRSRAKQNIVDLRVFGYFSRFADRAQRYFLNEVLTCVENRRPLLTDAVPFVRDYVHFQDLAACIELCLGRPGINAGLDMYSLLPIDKFGILKFFQENFGLEYRVDGPAAGASPTGNKANYYSLSRTAESLLGYRPTRSSLDCLREEATALLADRR